MSARVYHRRAQTAKRILWGAMILIGIGLLVLLYSFKTMAQSARKDVQRLEAQIQSETDQIQLLKAEIVFLERPDRLAELGETALGLSPLQYEARDVSEAIQTIPFRDSIVRHQFKHNDVSGGQP